MNGRVIAVPRAAACWAARRRSTACSSCAGIRATSTAGAMLGCAGWGYADVLPYFKKLESSWRGAVPYHGARGPMPIAPIDTTKLLHEPLMQTAAPAGFWTSDDMHGRLEEGFARAELTVDARGRRASAARAYLHPVRHRAEPRSHAGRADHARAGRERPRRRRRAARGNETRRVFAEREVILCGGTYNSAQLLLLSGFGPADELRATRHPCARRSARRRRESLRARARRPAVRDARAGVVPARTARRSRRDFAAALDAVRHRRLRDQVSSCNVVIRTDPALAQPDIQLMCNPVRMDAKVWFPLLEPPPGAPDHRRTPCCCIRNRAAVCRLRSADPARQAAHRVQLPRRARRPRHAAPRTARRAPHLCDAAAVRSDRARSGARRATCRAMPSWTPTSAPPPA